MPSGGGGLCGVAGEMMVGGAVAWVGLGEVPRARVGQCLPPARSGLESSVPQSAPWASEGSADSPRSGRTARRELFWVGCPSSHCLPERKFHALRISRQGAREVELAWRPRGQGMEGAGVGEAGRACDGPGS